MRKIGFLFLLSVGGVLSICKAQTARIISECTIVYNLSIEDGNSSPELIQSLKGASKTVYIKGSKSRTDLVSPSYSLTIINDTKKWRAGGIYRLLS